MAKQRRKLLTICLRQWRLEQRGNIGPQVLQVARTKQHDMHTRFVPHKAIGRICHTTGAAFVEQKAQRVTQTIYDEVDFGTEPATTTAERLFYLPPFSAGAPAAQG